MPKKVLIMCTGNSCRSIIAEALVNSKLEGVQAYSCGVKPSGKININAKKILVNNNIWNESYYSKHLNDVLDIDFDLVVTVCTHADATCPTFPKKLKVIHVGFEDPDGKGYDTFIKTYTEIENILLSRIKKEVD